MIAVVMEGTAFKCPAGMYIQDGKFGHITMAMETMITAQGITYNEVTGTSEEESELGESYTHLCKLRDEVIEMGVLPPVKELNKLNTIV